MAQDHYNSGVNNQGVRKFEKRVTKVNDENIEWWECIQPKWHPSTKMIQSGQKPPWKDYYQNL